LGRVLSCGPVAISPYLAELRELVGHRYLLIPGATVLIWNQAGELLMVRNIETGRWQTVGGAVDPGESPRQAAVREAREETGVEVELDALRDVVGGENYQVHYPNGDHAGYVGSVFDAHVVGGELRTAGDGDEVSEVRWWSLAALSRADITHYTRVLLSDLGLLGA
ncbi:MAG: NUDIX domain-containing protein, partial [Solirubrobacterales bacterium]|nr:NUDIX domain-containing protein [Solirubrobacterales bacterium]